MFFFLQPSTSWKLSIQIKLTSLFSFSDHTHTHTHFQSIRLSEHVYWDFQFCMCVCVWMLHFIIYICTIVHLQQNNNDINETKFTLNNEVRTHNSVNDAWLIPPSPVVRSITLCDYRYSIFFFNCCLLLSHVTTLFFYANSISNFCDVVRFNNSLTMYI